ncbi:MAG: GIY-YIG nuclease family protein [Anaerolineaceae bacterium]|nr:GIY-YIG nuclease family protein [Anaerolineaceae bacterium]
MMFPADKGTYILILRLSKPVSLTPGRLGTFDFPGGWYAYVGSAFGPGGLRGRLKHHLAPINKPHWHVDYLRDTATVREVWWLASETVYEHQWAAVLRGLPGAAVPALRFGASDCTCESHLFHFPRQPDFAAFRDSSNQPLRRHRVPSAPDNT